MDEIKLEINTYKQNDSFPLISKNSNRSDITEKCILYKKWWSSFCLLKYPWIDWVLLTISFLTMMYQLLGIMFWEKFDIMADTVDIHRIFISYHIYIFVSIVIFVGCCYEKYYKLFEYLYDKLYREGDTSTNYLVKFSYRDSVILFISNIHHNWIYLFVLSAFFSIIVPMIHPDMKQEFSLYRVSGKKIKFLSF
jgi:hypothetical protein